jgi:hypothetical protein
MPTTNSQSTRRALEWLVEFAESARLELPIEAEGCSRTQSKIEIFIRRATAGGWARRKQELPLTVDQIRQLGAFARRCLHERAERGSGQYTELPAADLSTLIFVALPGVFSFRGSAFDSFRFACVQFLGSQQGRLIAECPGRKPTESEPRAICSKLFVRERRSRYCGAECARRAEAEAARRKRAELTPEERYSERHRYYQNWINEHRGGWDVKRRGPRLARSKSRVAGVRAQQI